MSWDSAVSFSLELTLSCWFSSKLSCAFRLAISLACDSVRWVSLLANFPSSSFRCKSISSRNRFSPSRTWSTARLTAVSISRWCSARSSSWLTRCASSIENSAEACSRIRVSRSPCSLACASLTKWRSCFNCSTCVAWLTSIKCLLRIAWSSWICIDSRRPWYSTERLDFKLLAAFSNCSVWAFSKFTRCCACEAISFEFSSSSSFCRRIISFRCTALVCTVRSVKDCALLCSCFKRRLSNSDIWSASSCFMRSSALRLSASCKRPCSSSSSTSEVSRFWKSARSLAFASSVFFFLKSIQLFAFSSRINAFLSNSDCMRASFSTIDFLAASISFSFSSKTLSIALLWDVCNRDSSACKSRFCFTFKSFIVRSNCTA